MTRSPPAAAADGAETASGIGEEESGWGVDTGRPPVAAAAAGRGEMGGAGGAGAGAGAGFGVNSFPAKSELGASRHPFTAACLAGRQWYYSCVKT